MKTDQKKRREEPVEISIVDEETLVKPEKGKCKCDGSGPILCEKTNKDPVQSNSDGKITLLVGKSRNLVLKNIFIYCSTFKHGRLFRLKASFTDKSSPLYGNVFYSPKLIVMSKNPFSELPPNGFKPNYKGFEKMLNILRELRLYVCT